jgi:hypothetical protein
MRLTPLEGPRSRTEGSIQRPKTSLVPAVAIPKAGLAACFLLFLQTAGWRQAKSAQLILPQLKTSMRRS